MIKQGFLRSNCVRMLGIAFVCIFLPVIAHSQRAPQVPDRPWDSNRAESGLHAEPGNELKLDPTHIYALAELIDLAELNNPETREAWAFAKGRAARLGISRSDLYPTLVASALGATSKDGVLINDNVVLQTIGEYDLAISLSYTLLDFGERRGHIDEDRAQLLAANFEFNQVHLKIVSRVLAAFFRLQQTQGEVAAAEANLTSARTVREAAEQRLDLGVATVPDLLEARSAEARAVYNLESARGARMIASGNLATVLTASPASDYKVQSLDSLPIPNGLNETAEQAINKALSQRPDLLAQMERVRAASGAITSARSEWYPRLTFQGDEDFLRAYGEQTPFPGVYAGANTYHAELSLNWTVFDGGRRRNEVEQAHASQKQAQSAVDRMRDEVSDEVWKAYSDVNTAFRQRDAATMLLTASTDSYEAALQSYRLGVRNLVDLLAAERDLADARSADITARVSVLNSLAELAYSTGDLLKTTARRPAP
jgi:outer membrane protein